MTSMIKLGHSNSRMTEFDYVCLTINYAYVSTMSYFFPSTALALASVSACLEEAVITGMMALSSSTQSRRAKKRAGGGP